MCTWVWHGVVLRCVPANVEGPCIFWMSVSVRLLHFLVSCWEGWNYEVAMGSASPRAAMRRDSSCCLRASWARRASRRLDASGV